MRAEDEDLEASLEAVTAPVAATAPPQPLPQTMQMPDHETIQLVARCLELGQVRPAC